LNMRNGITEQLIVFHENYNPNLTCIEVLDPVYATANWTSAKENIDTGVTFSVICGGTDLTKWHVDPSGSDAQGKGTLASPLATIQTGINAVSAGNTVFVAAGTYVENINFNGKNISVIGENRETTIIDGNELGSVVTFENKETSSAILSGFTIQNGSASKGGGIFCDNSSPTLTNVTVSGNTATDGGGIYSANSSPTITSTEVTDNYGGWGGGFCILFGSALTGGNPTISNTLVAKNHGKYHGGGLYIDETKVSLTNVSITENTSNEMQGAGIHARNRSNIELVNVIHWNNEPSSIVFQEDGFKSEISISNSDIESGQSGVTTNSNADITWADGNIDADPMFVDTANDDYHLSNYSPSIGAGTSSGAPSTDLDGNPRPNPAGSNPDMGAYENPLAFSSFDLVYPFPDTTIVLTRANFLDTLYFAWNQPASREGDELTYKRELTGDLPEYIRFIVTSDEETNTNMYKVPYHHIEDYMHTAGVELITGTWTIVANDGKYDVHAENGPFTLTIDGSKLEISDSDIIPETFALYANYPNPFNPTTTISYDLPKRSQVTLGIYNILGKQIKTLVNQSQDAGNRIAVWDGTDNLGRQVSAGVYLYQIQAGEFTQTRKMLLLK